MSEFLEDPFKQRTWRYGRASRPPPDRLGPTRRMFAADRSGHTTERAEQPAFFDSRPSNLRQRAHLGLAGPTPESPGESYRRTELEGALALAWPGQGTETLPLDPKRAQGVGLRLPLPPQGSQASR